MESLVLNMVETPVSIIEHTRAVTLVMINRAIVLKSYPGTQFRSMHISMPIPSVIQCTHTDYMPRTFTNVLPFTRKNLFIRDRGHCMYCGKKVSLSSMSFDHVVPKSLGGKTGWNNIVLSCFRCNGKKGSRSPDKFRAPLRAPYTPRLSHAAPSYLVNKLAAEIIEETWMDFIYWGIILEQD